MAETLVKRNETELVGKIGSEFKIESNIPRERRVSISIDKEDVAGICNLVKEMGYAHLSAISANDWPSQKAIELTYHVWSYTDKILLTIKTKLDRSQPATDSVIPVWQESAQIHERELHELFGVAFNGNDDLTPLFLEGWQDSPPFLKDFDMRKHTRETLLNKENPAEADYWLDLPSALYQPREHTRELPVAERVTNFEEVEATFDEATLKRQAYRCLQCGEPQCVIGCPAHLNVKKYNMEAAMGDYKASMQTILERLPFPTTIGRICPHPCEDACTLHLQFEAVTIREIKRFVADQFLDADWYPKPKEQKAEKVAVVGGGPAGLTAARNLAIAGYPVTVFDSSTNPGGMLLQSIPEYRLPQQFPLKEIEEIKKLGVKFEVATLGKDLTLKSLGEKGFQAIFLGIGAHAGMMMNIPGEELPGVYEALELLKHIKEGKSIPDFKGKKVVVVGGGNVAMDAVRSTLRLGAEVTLVYRRSWEGMPATQDEVDAAKAEGVVFNILTNPTKILGNKKVEEVECIRMELGDWDASGRRRPVPVPGSDIKIPADYFIEAIGEFPEAEALSAAGIETTRGGLIKVDNQKRTTVPGVFAGGDVVTGPATIIEAVAAGLEAAEAIDKHLSGKKKQG